MTSSDYPHVGLLTFAKDFARVADASFDCSRKLPKLSLAGYYLVGHAIELSLKSAVLLNGANEKDLRALGHDLEKAADQFRLTRHEQMLSSEMEAIIAMLNPYYSAKELEYFMRAKGMRLPEPEITRSETQSLIEELETEYRRLMREAS